MQNHYEWDEQCLSQSKQEVFETLARYLDAGGYNPAALTSNYCVLYVLNGVRKPLTLVELNPYFLEIDALVETLKSVWLWLCFNWRYYAKPVPVLGTDRQLLFKVWLDMVKKQCYPPYRKRRCRRVPMFFHKPAVQCSFCNPSSVIPKYFHCLELLYLHTWTVISKVNWEQLIALAMTQPFTVHHSPYIPMRHQFTVFKMIIDDHYNELDDS